MAKQIDLFQVKKNQKFKEIPYDHWKLSLVDEEKKRAEIQESKDITLNNEDMKALGAGKRRVLKLMLDRRWHTASDIREVAGGSEGLRRLRELRKHYVIEKRRVGLRTEYSPGMNVVTPNRRHYEYRLGQAIFLPEEPSE